MCYESGKQPRTEALKGALSLTCEFKTSHLITLGHRENTSAASVDQISAWDVKMSLSTKEVLANICEINISLLGLKATPVTVTKIS